MGQWCIERGFPALPPSRVLTALHGLAPPYPGDLPPETFRSGYIPLVSAKYHSLLMTHFYYLVTCDKPYATIHWPLNLLERYVVCGSHVFLPGQSCPQQLQPGPPSALAFLYQKLKSLSQPLLLRLPCYNKLAHAHHCSSI